MNKLKLSVIGASALLTFNALAASLEDGRYVLSNVYSGKVMEVYNASQDDGANIVQWSLNNGEHQKWDISNLGNGYYQILSAHSGKSLDVYAWNDQDGAEVRQWAHWGADNQQWAINQEADGSFNIISKYSGKSIEVYNFNANDGADIRLWSYWGGDTQKWNLQPASTAPSNSRGSNCVSTGSVTVSSTIVVTSGVYDGNCKTFNPTSALGDGGQAEGQKPVFRIENGTTLKNVIIGKNGADGIHLYNGGTLDNIRWTDIGEDALTVKSAGNVTIKNIDAYNGYDKFMQINAATNLHISNCIVDGAGKFLRQNGGSNFTINVTADNCEISNLKEAVFRTDSSSSTARITNSTLKNYGEICYGSWKSCSYSGITFN